MQYLADIDAHSWAMANSDHYDLSDHTRSDCVKKSMNVYIAAMGRNPRTFRDDAHTWEEFHILFLGGRTRKKPSDEAADTGGKAPNTGGRDAWSSRAKRVKLVNEVGEAFLKENGKEKLTYKEFKHIAKKVSELGEQCTPFQVRYIFTGHQILFCSGRACCL